MTTDDVTSIQRELEAALEAVAEHERVLQRLAEARRAEEAAQGRAGRAREQLADEESDVRALESFSPTRIWAGMRGSRDTDLDQEQAERQAAEYAVARADADLLAAREETRRGEARLAELGDVQGRRERALAAKEAWLRSTPSEAGAALTGVAEQLASTRSELTEAREALDAGLVAAERLHRAREALGKAGDWATYDTFLGGGLLGDAMKYDRMDKAQALLHEARQALTRLSVELADVDMEAVVHGLRVDGFTQTLDVWFDNIFTDWAVRSQISDVAASAAETAEAVQQVCARLSARVDELASRESSLVVERHTWLMASSA